jgi:hypothetical protein
VDSTLNIRASETRKCPSHVTSIYPVLFALRQTSAPTIIGIRTDRLKLDDLNNDVLLIICDYLDVPTWLPNNGRSPGIKYTPLKNLSRVNRRMRALLRPIIMQSIASIELEPPKKNGERPDGWATVHKTIEGITQDSFLLRTVRYLQLSCAVYPTSPPSTSASQIR